MWSWLLFFSDMDTIRCFTTLALLTICCGIQAEEERTLQSKPQDDSYRLVKYLQLYQQYQQRLANTKYANELNSRYYPRGDDLPVLRSRSSGTSDEDNSETYEAVQNSDWSPGDVQRHRDTSRHRSPMKTTANVLKSESQSHFGNISVKVYPPRKEQDEVGETDDIAAEVELSTDAFKEEVLQEEKKSLQSQMSNDVSFLSYSPSSKEGPFALSHSAEEATTSNKNPLSDIYFIVIVAGCSAAAIFGVIAAGYCFYKFQKTSKAAAEVDYPAYGVTGPSKEHTSPSGDRKLAHSAQMYHYQHQKQQMIAVENATTNRQTSNSDVDSEEENEEGDYTVYECPGLAPTGEMEVKNPLFHDDSTPMSPPVTSKEIKKP